MGEKEEKTMSRKNIANMQYAADAAATTTVL
jgi:hypothetical protein